VYIICCDHDGYFQGPDDQDCSPQSAQERITLAAMLIQSFTAEKMSEHGFGKSTFQLEHNENMEPVCMIFQSKLTTEKAHSMSGDELWSYFAREFIENLNVFFTLFSSEEGDFCSYLEQCDL
jgi:hypothetical protein